MSQTTIARVTGEPRAEAAAGIAGVALLAMAVLAAFGNFVVIEAVVVDGDPLATTENIDSAGVLFNLGVLSMYAVVLLDVLVAWALTLTFESVNPPLARLAGWLRLAYSGVFMVAIAALASGDAVAFENTWQAGLLLFGASLLVVGWLTVRCIWLPSWLGLLVIVAGAGYGLDAIVATLVSDPAVEISAITFIGEVLLAVWLVMRWAQGRRIVSRRMADRPA
jgi:hypothetical protein